MGERSLRSGPFESEPHCRYIIVVAATDEALFHDLEVRFAADPRTRVVLDRRRLATGAGPTASPTVERRHTRSSQISALGVAVIRLADDPSPQGGPHNEPAGWRSRMTMEGIEGVDDRQRVDRWLEESQYLIGRLIPAYLDDRERVRARLETVERDNERLRIELADARRQMAELGVDLELLRAERLRIADSFHTIVEHLTALQSPITDVASRLHAAQPVGSDAKM